MEDTVVLHNADCMPLTDRYSIHCTNDDINLPCACSVLRREGHSQHELTCTHHRGAVGCQPSLTLTRALSTHALTPAPHRHSPLTLTPAPHRHSPLTPSLAHHTGTPHSHPHSRTTQALSTHPLSRTTQALSTHTLTPT